MKRFRRSSLLYTWLFLCVATIGGAAISWELGPSSHGSVSITALVLLIAIVKSRVVMRSYMEVRSAPSWLQLTCDAWLASMFGALVVLYWS